MINHVFLHTIAQQLHRWCGLIQCLRKYQLVKTISTRTHEQKREKNINTMPRFWCFGCFCSLQPRPMERRAPACSRIGSWVFCNLAPKGKLDLLFKQPQLMLSVWSGKEYNVNHDQHHAWIYLAKPTLNRNENLLGSFDTSSFRLIDSKRWHHKDLHLKVLFG